MQFFHSSRLLLGAAIAIAGGALGLVACSGEWSTPVLARVFLVDGPSVQIDEENTPKGSPHFDRLIGAGSHWVLPTGKRAIIFLVPGIMATAANETELEIKELRLAKDGNETEFDMKGRKVGLRLLRGDLIVSVAVEESRIDVQIETGNGILAVESGSLLEVRTRADRIHIACLRGKIQLETRKMGKVAPLRAGYWCDWRGGEAFPGEPVAATANLQIQKQFDAAFDAETSMRKLLLAEQQSVPKWRHP